MSRVKFETLKSEEIKFGRNNFIEVARKKAVTEEGEENEFISISRGYYDRDNMRKYKANISFPPNEEFIKQMVSILESI